VAQARPAQHLSEAAEHDTVFNGTDLSGLEEHPYAPKPAYGVGHSLAKVFGGGNAKPHTANWSVRNGTIHGEAAPAL